MTLTRFSAHAPRLIVSAACSAVFIAAAGMAGPAVAQVPKRPPRAAATAPAPVYFPDRFDWQKRSPSDAGMDAVTIDEAVQFAVANENPATKDLAVDLGDDFRRPGAVRHADRPDEGARRRERPHHPPWLHRGRVGRHLTRRHDLQRDEDVPVDRRRPRLAARA